MTKNQSVELYEWMLTMAMKKKSRTYNGRTVEQLRQAITAALSGQH